MPDRLPPPWTAVLFRHPDGTFGVRVEVDLCFPTREAATEAGAALLGHLDRRLADLGERLREVAEPPPVTRPPEVAQAPLPLFVEPAP